MPSRGYTLTELLVVVVLIGLAASVALPSLRPGEIAAVDSAAGELASALRFARTEAMRLSDERGFERPAETRIRLFSLDNSSSPATPIFDIRHPVDKQLYDRDLGRSPVRFEGTITADPQFRSTCNQPDLLRFDARGMPWCIDPANVPLLRYDFTLSQGASSRVVTLQGINGRVSVQ